MFAPDSKSHSHQSKIPTGGVASPHTTLGDTAMTEFTDIVYEVEGRSALIRINRPEKRNAFTYHTLAEIRKAVDLAVAEPKVAGIIVDGMDALAVYEATGGAIARARAGSGPTFLEFKTYRYFDHVGVRGMGVIYREDAEVLRWRERDPIGLMETRLAEQGVLSPEAAAAVHEAALAEVRDAIAFAEASPFPEPGALMEDIYTVAGGVA